MNEDQQQKQQPKTVKDLSLAELSNGIDAINTDIANLEKTLNVYLMEYYRRTHNAVTATPPPDKDVKKQQ